MTHLSGHLQTSAKIIHQPFRVKSKSTVLKILTSLMKFGTKISKHRQLVLKLCTPTISLHEISLFSVFNMQYLKNYFTYMSKILICFTKRPSGYSINIGWGCEHSDNFTWISYRIMSTREVKNTSDFCLIIVKPCHLHLGGHVI